MADKQDKAEEDSFPASDAPANSGIADAKGDKKPTNEAAAVDKPELEEAKKQPYR